MQKNRLLTFRLLTLLGFLCLSGITFRFFYFYARNPEYEILLSIYTALILIGFVLYLGVLLFKKWFRIVFVAACLTPFFWGLFGLQNTGALILFVSVWGMTGLLFYWEANATKRQIVYAAELEKAENEENVCQGLIQEQQERLKALQKKKDRTTLLRDAIQGNSYTLAEETLCQMLVQRVFSLIEKAESVYLSVFDPDKKAFAPVVFMHRQEESAGFEIENTEVFQQWVWENRQPLFIKDLKKEFRFEVSNEWLKRETFPKSLMFIPLISEDKIMGVLSVVAKESNVLGVDDLRLTSILSNFYALLIHNARLSRQTEQLANVDGLTQLAVKRCLKERFKSFFEKKPEKERLLSIIMLDIDHFKKINDTHGHLVGDAVLVHIAEVLKKFSPQNGLVCRYGGEEFSLFLPEYSKKEALELAEKLRLEVAKNKLMIRRKEIVVTFSAGVATFPKDGLIEENLLRSADEALYRAKSGGRNRVVGC